MASNIIFIWSFEWNVSFHVQMYVYVLPCSLFGSIVQAGTFFNSRLQFLRCFPACNHSFQHPRPLDIFLGLVAIHTLWMRQHNRIARQLSDINPHWNDEQLFQVKEKALTAVPGIDRRGKGIINQLPQGKRNHNGFKRAAEQLSQVKKSH